MEHDKLSSTNTHISLNKPLKKKFKTSALICYFKAPHEQDVNDYAALKEVFTRSLISKKWRGHITLTNQIVKIKSFNGRFKKHYKYSYIRGIFSPSDFSRELTIMVELGNLYYFMLYLKTENHTKRILQIIDQIKKTENPHNSGDGSEIFTNSDAIGDTSTTKNLLISDDYKVPDSPINPMTATSTFMLSNDNEMPAKQDTERVTMYNTKSAASSYIFNGFTNGYYTSDGEMSSDSDDDRSSISDEMHGKWVEDVTYLEYEPSLGCNVASESGSVYMYSAHQLTARSNMYYSDSDSDKEYM